LSQSKLISQNKSFIKNKISPEEEFEINSRNENNFQTYFHLIMLNIITFTVMDDLFGLEKKIRKANMIKILTSIFPFESIMIVSKSYFRTNKNYD
jgi:hypothetical protein